MLATLFDFPFEDRYLCPTGLMSPPRVPLRGRGKSARRSAGESLNAMLEYFYRLWKEREAKPGNDFISLMAQSPAFAAMDPMTFMGQLNLLIIGGNDTTRNSISGGVYALNRFPEAFEKVKAQPELIPNMVAEIIRWQTPLAHMRRTVKKILPSKADHEGWGQGRDVVCLREPG